MKFLIIIPVHNEEEYIHSVLESLERQEYSNFDCIVVNDGSGDQSQQIIENFIIKLDVNRRFRLLNLKKSEHEPGAKVINTFNAGLSKFDLNLYDIICKFDADIIFPVDYLSVLVDTYQKNAGVGMVSGLVYIKKDKDAEKDIFNFANSNNSWKYESISNKDHIRGPIKSYRRKCFLDMNGLRTVLGWDNIDVMLAKKNGWETITIKNIWVKHLKPTAFQYQDQKAEKLGLYFYNIGLNFPLATISSLKSSYADRSLKNFFTMMRMFLKQNHQRSLTSDEIKYIRNLRWTELKAKFKKII